jgi:hypothetical protein
MSELSRDRNLSGPEETTDLEARSIAAMREAGNSRQLTDAWNGIRAEFRALGLQPPSSLATLYRDRRMTQIERDFEHFRPIPTHDGIFDRIHHLAPDFAAIEQLADKELPFQRFMEIAELCRELELYFADTRRRAFSRGDTLARQVMREEMGRGR